MYCTCMVPAAGRWGMGIGGLNGLDCLVNGTGTGTTLDGQGLGRCAVAANR